MYELKFPNMIEKCHITDQGAEVISMEDSDV